MNTEKESVKEKDKHIKDLEEENENLREENNRLLNNLKLEKARQQRLR